jgi:predicted N-formylglutamate amidohydrolase
MRSRTGARSVPRRSARGAARADAAASAPHARIGVVVSCEHGGNDVPAEYRALFRGAGRVLASHRGWDPGAADVARALAARLSAPLFLAETTRLLVDLNRSLGHPRVFSEFTRALPPDGRARLLREHYSPYRSAVEACVAEAAARGEFVLHVSSHSFTPILDGNERCAHAALLFDPGRPAEAAFAAIWRKALRELAPAKWIVRRNYPYRGTADGLTTHLRKCFTARCYAGIELEVNQRLVREPAWGAHVAALAGALDAALRRFAVPDAQLVGRAVG